MMGEGLMKGGIWMLVALLGLITCLGEAKAGIIVYQPLNAGPTGPQFGLFSNGVNSGSGGRQEIASGFILASPAVVVDAQWYGAYRFGTTPSAATTFLIRFFA